MKSIRFIGLFILATINNTAVAQTETDSVKVSGNCSMCKRRIEKSAAIPGVLQVNWDVSSKILKVSYSSKQLSLAAIMQKVAASGHDTELVKATEQTYNKLPDCCRYERSILADTKTIIKVKENQ